MEKLDLKKQYKTLYSPSAKAPQVIAVPALKFLMVDGAIEPGLSPGTSPAFQEALGALYGAAYTLKFMSKQRPVDPLDYSVMGLEALWWVEDGLFDITKPDNWHWRALILQPEHITAEMFAEAQAKVSKKRPSPSVERLRLETYEEGLSVQMMHLGPYATEPQTLARMQAYVDEHGYRMRGLHHEIYLGDPLRTAPEKLKTILRHPVEKTD